MEALENRGLGRPKETVEHQVSKSQELKELTHEERQALYADLLRREQLELGAGDGDIGGP